MAPRALECGGACPSLEPISAKPVAASVPLTDHCGQPHTQALMAMACVLVREGSCSLPYELIHIILEFSRPFLGKKIKTLKGHTGPVLCLTVYYGHLFSGSDDTTIRMWQADGRCVPPYAALDMSIPFAPSKTNLLRYRRRGFRAGIISWEIFAFKEGGEISPCGM